MISNHGKELIVSEIFDGFYVIENLYGSPKKFLYNDEFRTEYITHPTILKYSGTLTYDKSCLKVTSLQVLQDKFINSDYGIITSSNINSGLIFETNYFLKYINSKGNLDTEIFYFPTSAGRNSDINNEYNYIYSGNDSIKAIYNEGKSIKQFIEGKKVILIYEIFSYTIFDFILSLGTKIVFLINSDCFINWDDKKNRNINDNINFLHKLKCKYKDKFIICSKNIPTKNKLVESSIDSELIPFFIGNDKTIDYKSFEQKYKNLKKINIAIILGAGYQKNHRKSIEQYLDTFYEIIKKNESIVLNIYTPKSIEYKVKSFKNLKIHHNITNEELKAELDKTLITFYFAKHDGLGITPFQCISSGCYTISTFNHCLTVFDCYNLKSYIDTEIVGEKNMSNVYEIKDVKQIEFLFEKALQTIANMKDDDILQYHNNIININSYKTLSLSLLKKHFISECCQKSNEKIIISAATYPRKQCQILYNIENLILYADHTYIYLNEYEKVPKLFAILNETKLFTIKVCKDLKALSKFNVFDDYKNIDFIFTIDDDLYYSENYIKDMIQKYISLKKFIPKDLILSSVARVFNNIKITRYNSPTKIIRIDNEGKSIIKSTRKLQYEDQFVDLVGTGNSLFYNTEYINNIIKKISSMDISFKNVSLDETLSIVTNKKNIVMVASSMNNKIIFERNTCHGYNNFNNYGLHEMKNSNIQIIQSIESTLKQTDFYSLEKYRFKKIKMLFIGWWSVEAFPCDIISNLFSDLDYDIYFYGLKEHMKLGKTNNDILDDINDHLLKHNIEIIYWFNWKIDIEILKILKTKNTNVTNVMFNWDPVDIKLNPSFHQYFEIMDFIFISQELNSTYDSKKYIKYYPGFNYNIEPNHVINDGFYGDVCFVITNYYDNRAELIRKLIDNNIHVDIYGPEKLKSDFPNNYKHCLKKREVYDIYNRYKISINLTIDTDATEYINERVAEIFYSNGLMLTNFENNIIVNKFNSYVFKNIDDCVTITKSVLKDYNNKNFKKINYIKNNAFNTAIEFLDYRKSILKQHFEIMKTLER